MKHINLTIALVFTLLISGCNHPARPVVPAQPQGIENPTNQGDLITCTHKYSNSLNFSYYEANKSVHHPQYFPDLTVYYIIDVNGKHWTINEYDLVNYNCVITQKATP